MSTQDNKTFTEKNIEKKTKNFPPILKGMAQTFLLNKYKERIDAERDWGNSLKVQPPQNDSFFGTIVIDEKDIAENEQKREKVKNILYTEYNKDLDKSLHDYFIQNKGNAIHKWFAYFDEYEKHFGRFRGKDVNILEIGIQNGGSARMWKEYFSQNGAKVNIYGVDIDPRCKELETEGIQIFIGSQEDREFLRQLKTQIPKVDILIDDGGHTMRQQITTFEEMFDHVKDNGVYWVEDVHTSYWESFGGGGGSEISFIDYTKRLIDELNAFYATKKSDLEITPFTRTAYSITYYDSVVVFEKRLRPSAYEKIAPLACIGKLAL